MVKRVLSFVALFSLALYGAYFYLYSNTYKKAEPLSSSFHKEEALLSQSEPIAKKDVFEEIVVSPKKEEISSLSETEKACLALQEALKTKNIDALRVLWKKLASLSFPMETLAADVGSFLINQLGRILHTDDASLSKTRLCVDFWNQLSLSNPEKEFLCSELVHQAELLWLKDRPLQSERVIELALELTSDRNTLAKHISSFLTQHYIHAEKCHWIERLVLIHDIFTQLKLPIPKLPATSTFANHTADAEYLFKSEKFAQAKTLSQWILKNEPHNEKALRMFGLSSFHLGQFVDALSSLQQLSSIDPYVYHALATSQTLTQQASLSLAQVEDEVTCKQDTD